MSKRPVSSGEAKPKLKFSVNIMGDTSHESKGSTPFFQGLKDLTGSDTIEVEALTAPAMVISRLNHPATLSYDGLSMIIPPRGREKIANMNKLGALPQGVFVTPIQV